MLHVLYVATEGRALSHIASATPSMIVCKSEARKPTVFVCIDRILGVKHGFAAFVI